MFVDFDKFWSWLDNAGCPQGARKWVARLTIVGALIYVSTLLYGGFYNKEPRRSIRLEPPPGVAQTPSTIPLDRRSDGDLLTVSCAIALRAGRDYNFNVEAHQLEAWSLYEQAVSQLSIEEKQNINIHLIEEVRRDWGKGLPREALTKFGAVFAFCSASKPNTIPIP